MTGLDLPPASGAPSTRGMRLAIAGSLLLLVLAFAAFYFASDLASRRKAEQADAAIPVAVTDARCEPADLTVPAGRAAFAITNRSNRVMEWEILDGVMVVEERENIAPGMTISISTRLKAGTYQITCGLLGNPRGTLQVTPSAAADEDAGTLSLDEFIGPLAEYQMQAMVQADAFAKATVALAAAVKAGDVSQARALYAAARAPYSHLLPIADLFGDLDARINARADDFRERERDLQFAGLHRLEFALFEQQSTEGLGPVADRLAADAQTLKERVGTLQVMPDRLIAGATRLLRRAAGLEAVGAAEAYAHSDLADIQAETEAVLTLARLLYPLLETRAPDLPALITAHGDALSSLLSSHREGTGFSSAKTLTSDQQGAVATALNTLGDDMDALGVALTLTRHGQPSQ